MGFQLRKLPLSTQQVLHLAACVGNSFDLETLAIVSEQSEIDTAADLWKALQEGLILPTSDIYKFYQQESLVSQGDLIPRGDALANHQASVSLIDDRQKMTDVAE